MDIADEALQSQIDGEWRSVRRKQLASIAEIYALSLLVFVIFAAEYFSKPHVDSAIIFAILLEPKVVGSLAALFFSVFVYLLTGYSILVNFLNSSSLLTKFVEVSSLSSAAGAITHTADWVANLVLKDQPKVNSAPLTISTDRNFDQVAQEFLARSSSAARVAQGRPNALLFVGTIIAGLGLVFFVLTLPGAQLGSLCVSPTRPLS